MHQADMRYVRTVYDPQQGLSQEHELSTASAALLRNSESRRGGGGRSGLGREFQGKVKFCGNLLENGLTWEQVSRTQQLP